MKIVKKLPELSVITRGEKFLMKCPHSGIVHIMRQYRSSVRRNHYMSSQGYSKGRVVFLRVVTPTGRRHHLTQTELQTKGATYVLSSGY